MKSTSMVSAVAMVAATVLLVGACSTGGVPSADSMPEGASFSGLWYSEQFEHMYVYTEGDDVEGVYAYGGGGTIEGTIEGNLMLFEWEEPPQHEAEREMSGHGYFQLVVEGAEPELRGEWGYDEDRRGAGPWEAEYVREIEEGDPETIEELREVH